MYLSIAAATRNPPCCDAYEGKSLPPPPRENRTGARETITPGSYIISRLGWEGAGSSRSAPHTRAHAEHRRPATRAEHPSPRQSGDRVVCNPTPPYPVTELYATAHRMSGDGAVCNRTSHSAGTNLLTPPPSATMPPWWRDFWRRPPSATMPPWWRDFRGRPRSATMPPWWRGLFEVALEWRRTQRVHPACGVSLTLSMLRPNGGHAGHGRSRAARACGACNRAPGGATAEPPAPSQRTLGGRARG